jgi:hypothetical protein
MKLVRMRTLGMFGIGFLAGSRAGRGPWEKAQASMEQIKGKVNGSMGSTGGDPYGSTSPNGMDSQRGAEGSPALTEM